MHMAENKAPTDFLPAERADVETLRRQRRAVLGAPKLIENMDAVHDIVVVLNRERQLVHANKAAVAYMRAHDGSPVMGARWGEALHCEHFAGGCGTTRFCRTCGAASVVWRSRFGRDAAGECRIAQKDGDTLDFRVSAAKIAVGPDELTVLTAVPQ